ncbi:hypothetical protein PTKIN_Ptkin12aG0084900 [Pterospermum kingtungense]
MEKLISSWYKDQSLPESYIFPPDKRLGNVVVPRCNTVPVIDPADCPTDIIQQIWKASQEFGLFQVIAAYSIEAKKLGLRILELLCESLGIHSGYFEDKLSEDLQLVVNYYPPLPDPSLTLGMPSHCDPNLLTILLQEDVISNKRLKGAEHWAVTNSSDA